MKQVPLDLSVVPEVLPQERNVYVFIIPARNEETPNPTLIVRSIKQVETLLKSTLPEHRRILKLFSEASQIICGVGERHFSLISLLGLKPTSYSPLCGTSACIDTCPSAIKKVIFGDGGKIHYEKWLTPDTRQFVSYLADKTLLIAGRHFMAGMGYNKAQPGEIIKISIEERQFPRVITNAYLEVIFSLKNVAIPVEK